MTKELIARLRNVASNEFFDKLSSGAITEAADELERLTRRYEILELQQINNAAAAGQEITRLTAEVDRMNVLHDRLMREADARRYELIAEVVKLTAENSLLRTLLPKLEAPCAYCGLTEISKCVDGFPGCAQADDLMCGEDEHIRRLTTALADARTEAENWANEADRLTAEVARKDRVLRELVECSDLEAKTVGGHEWELHAARTDLTRRHTAAWQAARAEVGERT